MSTANRASSRHALNRAGFLSEQNEFRLIALAQRGDQRAASKLIDAYKPFIEGVCRRHKSTMEHDDKVQIATSALWQSIVRFDPSYGRRLTANAKFRIRRDLDDAAMLGASRLWLGNSKARRSAHQNTLKVCSAMGIDYTKPLTADQVQAVADEIGVDPDHVKAVLETGSGAFSEMTDRLVCEDDQAAELVSRDAQITAQNLVANAIRKLPVYEASLMRAKHIEEDDKKTRRLASKSRHRRGQEYAIQRAEARLKAAIRSLMNENMLGFEDLISN